MTFSLTKFSQVSTTTKFKLNNKRKINFYWNIMTNDFASLVEGKQQHYLQKFCTLIKSRNHTPDEVGNTSTGEPKKQLSVFYFTTEFQLLLCIIESRSWWEWQEVTFTWHCQHLYLCFARVQTFVIHPRKVKDLLQKMTGETVQNGRCSGIHCQVWCFRFAHVVRKWTHVLWPGSYMCVFLRSAKHSLV